MPESSGVFASYVPQLVLRRLASVAAQPAEPWAERFPAALLHVDISGFTPLTTLFVQRGPAGIEELSRLLNAYLGQLIDLITEHGGDIVKFAGDGLLSIWPAWDEGLTVMTRRAVQCGLAIKATLNDYEVPDGPRLSLKISTCAGELFAAHVGGWVGRWTFLVAGDGVAQLSAAERYTRAGDIVLTPQAWALVADQCLGHPLDEGHMRLVALGEELEPRPLARFALRPGAEHVVRAYIPESVLARLDAGQADWLAELRPTTVLFTNVAGVNYAAPDALHQLQQLTQAAQRVLNYYEGWAKELRMDEKGTTLLAAFGLPPFTHEDDAVRAVQAALAVHAELQQTGFVGATGITTGRAFCGPVGNARRRDYAVHGQHVNLAARLMQAAPPNTVLCDAATYQAAQRRLRLDRLPPFVLKGLTSPVDVYRARPPAPAGGRASPMIGRRTEQAILTERLRAFQAGVGGTVLIVGEPGIGKSRLVEELVQQAMALGVRCLVGFGEAIEKSTSYHAWRTVFSRLLGLDTVSELEARRSQVLSKLRSDDESLRLAPLLNAVLSLDLPDNEITVHMSGQVRADNTRDLLTRLLQREPSTARLLLVLEDGHWLDSASWSLALRVSREVPSLLLVITMRPLADDQTSEYGAAVRAGSTQLRLDALSREEAVALACDRMGASSVAEPIAALLQERAGGQPFFIEQLAYAMRDTGQIVVADGICRPVAGAGDLSGSIVPDTVTGVIMSRIDQLPPSEALTLKVASVVGRRFAFRIVRDIHPLPVDEYALMDQLQTLARLDLIVPDPSRPDLTYEFRHVITQEVAYNLMLSDQRRPLHRLVAEWFERAHADDLSPYYGFLAHHWRMAGVASKAIDYLEKAGAQALDHFANEEAVSFLSQAKALDATADRGSDRLRRARWELQLGEAYVHWSRYREGRTHLETGLHLVGQPFPSTPWQQVSRLLGQLLKQTLRRLGLLQQVRQLSDDERATLVATFRACERLAEVSYYNNEMLLPLCAVFHILNEAEAAGIPAEMARGYAGAGALVGFIPLHRVAQWYLARALDALQGVSDLPTHEIVEIVVGFYYVGVGAWSFARERFEKVVEIARRLGDRRRYDDAVSNLMAVDYFQGAFIAGAALADELYASAGLRQDARFRALGLQGKCYCLLHLGKIQETMTGLDSLRALMTDQVGVPVEDLEIEMYGLLAITHLRRSEYHQALAASEQAVRLTATRYPSYFAAFSGYAGPADVYLTLWEAEQQASRHRELAKRALASLRAYARVFPIGQPRLRVLQGRYDWLMGRRGEALKGWYNGVAAAQELSMSYDEGLAYYEIGRHLEPADSNRLPYLARAGEIFTQLGAMDALAQVEQVRTGVPRVARM